MARPYFKVVEQYPYVRRSWQDVAGFSPPLRGFFVSPGTRCCGATLTPGPGPRSAPGRDVAAARLRAIRARGGRPVLSIWTLRQRLLLAGAIVAIVLLAMGTQGPGGGRYTYGLLYYGLPGIAAIRTPGRLVVWTTLAARGARRRRGRGDRAAGRDRRGLRRLVLLLPLLFVAEGVNTTPHPVVPPQPRVLAAAPAPWLVLPTGAATDSLTMLWGTDRFPAMVNGSAAFTPVRQAAIREAARRFPDRESVAMLRAIGVRTVVVLRDEVVGTPYEPALGGRTDGLPISRRDTPEAVVYTLDAR